MPNEVPVFGMCVQNKPVSLRGKGVLAKSDGLKYLLQDSFKFEVMNQDTSTRYKFQLYTLMHHLPMMHGIVSREIYIAVVMWHTRTHAHTYTRTHAHSFTQRHAHTRRKHTQHTHGKLNAHYFRLLYTTTFFSHIFACSFLLYCASLYADSRNHAGSFWHRTARFVVRTSRRLCASSE